MNRSLTIRSRAIAIASGLVFCSVVTEAIQIPASSSTSRPPASVTEDPGTWHRNPFAGSLKKGAVPTAGKAVPGKPGAVPPKQDQDIHLQGIMQVNNAFHALVNGRVVKPGDTIDGVTITGISRFRIVVQNDKKEKIIYDIYQGRIDRGRQ